MPRTSEDGQLVPGSGRRAAGGGQWSVPVPVPGAGLSVPRFLKVCDKGRRMALARRVGPCWRIPWRYPGTRRSLPSRPRGRYDFKTDRTKLPGPTTVHHVVCGSILHCNQPCGSSTQASGRLSDTRRDQLARPRQLTAGSAGICGGAMGSGCRWEARLAVLASAALLIPHAPHVVGAEGGAGRAENGTAARDMARTRFGQQLSSSAPPQARCYTESVHGRGRLRLVSASLCLPRAGLRSVSNQGRFGKT